jgi:hypothetical protein
MNPEQQAPVQANQPVTPTPAPQKKNVFPIVAALIALVIIIVALYFFATRLDTAPVPTDDAAAGTYDSEDFTTTEEVRPVSGTSDDVQSLEADLEASIDGLDNQNF